MEDRFKTFTVLVSNIHRSIHKIKMEEMAEFNLKCSHVSCLYYIYKSNSLTAKELCEICGEDKANISRTIKYLEDNGYIVSSDKKSKKYQTPLQLTDKGREVGKSVANKVSKVLDFTDKVISDEDRKIMYRSLNVISETLMSVCSKYEDK